MTTTFKVLLSFWLPVLSAIPQPLATTIIGPIYDSTGGLYTGSFTVQSQAKTNTAWAITGTTRIVYVSGGAIGALALIPNDSSTPNLTSYLVTFANGDKFTCIVQTIATPLPFTQECSPNALAPNVATAISASQVIPAPANGSVMATAAGITSWVPGHLVTAVAWSATPVFTVGTDQTMTLGGNVTSSTVTGIQIGSISVFRVCQPATGGPYTFAFPASFRGAGAIGSTAGKCSNQTFESFDGTTMEAISAMQVNQ